MMRLLARQAGPIWFQELSPTQITAADKILDAVSDETEDCQYKRCREVLRDIGLLPLPHSTVIMKSVRLSRGNDLAFLWLLYDMIYGTCEDLKSKKLFVFGERLILSCICHLDMMTTLRELDRVLPKPEKKGEAKCEQIEPSKCKAVKYASPYDEPVPKPTLQPKRFYPPLQRRHPLFELYKSYKDPGFVIENEVNRWFAYESGALVPNEARYIVKRIVCKQIALAVTEKSDRPALCGKHREESSKFNQMLRQVLSGKSNLEEKLKDFDQVDRGIIHEVHHEMDKAQKALQDLNDDRDRKASARMLMQQIVHKAEDLKYMRLCKSCRKCIEPQQNLIECVDEGKLPASDEQQIKFFHRPSPSSPLELDYEKIFATAGMDDCGVVRNSINRALGLEKHLTEDNAITVCLKDMWRAELDKWSEKRRQEMEEQQTRVVADCDAIGKSKQKVLGLLLKAIELMRKNPKFVLVQLPNVHRLPILREWILHRFGFRYGEEFIKRQMKVSKYQRDRLDMKGPLSRIDVPSYKALGIKRTRMTMDEASRKIKRVRLLSIAVDS